MEAIPASLVVKGLLVTLVRNVAWVVGNIAERLQVSLPVLRFKKRCPLFMRGIPKLPLNWARAKHGPILGGLCSSRGL